MVSCSVVDSYDCQAPANLNEDDQPARLPTCYRCGEPVCVNCSRRRKDRYARGRRTRRCLNCLEAEADYAAGYPDRTGR